MAKVLNELQRLAELLGWRGLREFHHSYGPIIWYETPDRNLHLQINANPQGQGQTKEFEATVVAVRYGFSPSAVCFHRFSLTAETVTAAAERLRPVLARSNFRDRQWKRFLASRAPNNDFP